MHFSPALAAAAFRNPVCLFKSARSVTVLAILLAALPGCHGKDAAPPAAGGISMQLTTSSFHDDKIPLEFTCDGANHSPQLSWTTPPPTTRSFALTVTDPDAPRGTFVHWVLYNMPAVAHELPAGLPTLSRLPDGSLQGRNDFGDIGYGGPCPPRNSTHRYVFDLYALDIKLELPSGSTRYELESAIKHHVQAHAQLTARYGR